MCGLDLITDATDHKRATYLMDMIVKIKNNLRRKPSMSDVSINCHHDVLNWNRQELEQIAKRHNVEIFETPDSIDLKNGTTA